VYTAEELAGATALHDRIVATFPRPPDDYWKLHVSLSATRFFWKHFEPSATPFTTRDDIWFPYRTAEDVGSWCAFLRPIVGRLTA
jgi:hypothetical protein